MKKYKNENGFSLVQVLIGLGLTGMLSVAVMNQMSNQNASSKRAERKIELDNFLNNIAKTLAKKDVCNYNFAHPDRNTLGNSAHSTLYANTAGKVLAKAGSSYLSDSVKITSISTSEVEDSSTEFKVVIKADRKKDQKNKNAYTTIKREIRISADMDGTTVNSCYFKLDSISDIQENENIDIADFCQGEGVVTEGSDGEKKCIFKAASLEDEHAKCKAGYSLRSLIYNPSTYYYEGTCEQNYTGSCSEIGDVDDSGNFTCLDIDSLYHSDQKVVLETGKELKLSVVGGKIQLNGGAGSSSGSSKVNGICDESVEYTCKTGALNKGIYISNTTQHRWSCDGKGGGSNSGLCSKDKSNYSWSEEPWGSCSGVPSTQTRIVRCVNANGITQNDSKCSESKPQETQTCSGTCPPKSFTLHGNPRILKDGRIGDKRLIKVEITPSGDPKKDLSCQVGNGSVPATAITYSFECRSNSQWALVNTKPQCDGNTGNTCFTKETRVSMFDSTYTEIADIKVGDTVLAPNGKSATVLDKMTFEHSSYKYSINGSEYFVTDSHPFKTVSGWKSFAPAKSMKEVPDIKVEKLKIGDILLTDHGIEALLSVDRVQNNEKVYNITVDGSHEYIANGYFVHNKTVELKCGTTTAGERSVSNCTWYGWGFNQSSGLCNNGVRNSCVCIDVENKAYQCFSR